MRLPCPLCGTAIEAALVMVPHSDGGSPRHHRPPTTGATGACLVSCACGARVSVSVLAWRTSAPAPHAHDGQRKCPHCGEQGSAEGER